MTFSRLGAGVLPVLASLLLSGCEGDDSVRGHEAELLRLHQEVLQAHRQGDVDRWMAVEADPYLSVNGGRISFPTGEERRAARGPYLQRATFAAYRDLREPVVRVSGDGSMAWLAAEVEVVGRLAGGDEEARFSEVWAWIELYEKVDGSWKIVGNASNSRPLETG